MTCAAFSGDTGTAMCKSFGSKEQRYAPSPPGKFFSGIPTGETLLPHLFLKVWSFNLSKYGLYYRSLRVSPFLGGWGYFIFVT